MGLYSVPDATELLQSAIEDRDEAQARRGVIVQEDHRRVCNRRRRTVELRATLTSRRVYEMLTF
jgi:hypothetical protein